MTERLFRSKPVAWERGADELSLNQNTGGAILANKKNETKNKTKKFLEHCWQIENKQTDRQTDKTAAHRGVRHSAKKGRGRLWDPLPPLLLKLL